MITIKEANEWEVASTYWAQFVSWKWAQWLAGQYFSWKVRCKYAVYEAHHARKKRLKELTS
jgi:hypothetical protein